jgi:transposase InsO family protein
MRDTIQRHVQACIPCQQYNYSRQKKAGHLHPIPPTDIPYSVISMDFCGPFIESPRENKFVLVISDLFTRHVTAIATPNNTAETTAMVLYREIFCKYGVCSTLITDQGTHFNNHLMGALTHLFGYNHIYSTAYHPQTNAVTERFNASLKVQISKLEDKHHNNWDDYIDSVVFAYNTSKHKTTQFSPFELLFGRSPQSPIDPRPQVYIFDRPNICFENLQRILKVYHQQAKHNIITQQQNNKARYDKHRTNPHYQIDDRVFTRIFAARGKLDPRYSSEPHIITQIHHPNYSVMNESTGVEKRFHVSDIRPFIPAYEVDSTTL